jgi:hypothetical protein
MARLKKQKIKSDVPRSFLSTIEIDAAMREEMAATGMSFSGLVRSILTQWFHFRGFRKDTMRPSARLLRERQK